MERRRVLVFGTFDGLHAGHQFFLRTAKTQGTVLIVSVARDKHVSELKQKIPIHREQERLQTIQKLPFVDEAFLSDEMLGSFSLMTQFKPDLILLGYDQTALELSLQEWMKQQEVFIPMRRLKKSLH